MPLIRPELPRVRFVTPPVALVICQIRFEPILRISDPAFIAPLQEAVRDEFPTVSRVSGIELAFGPEGLKADPTTSGAWSFASVGGDWQLIIEHESLTLQSRKHESYELLRERFTSILSTFVELMSPGARMRLALRYVNRIEFEDALNVSKWRELVRPELLGLAATNELADDGTIKHAFGQVRFAAEESQMIVRYGFMEEGTTTHPEVEPSGTPYFLLDLDHFDIRRFETIDLPEIKDQLDGFHEDIHGVFRWTITEEAARRFGVQELDGSLVSEGAQR
jgi:uncharacterized protein (TIGR04255 family)